MGEAKVYFIAMWSDHLLRFLFYFILLIHMLVCVWECKVECRCPQSQEYVSAPLELDLYEGVSNLTLLLGLNSSPLYE